MCKRYNLVKQGAYLVEWLNPLQLEAYKVAGWKATEYR